MRLHLLASTLGHLHTVHVPSPFATFTPSEKLMPRHNSTFARAGNELFHSHRDYGLEAMVAEIYDTRETASYFGVGVVKASVCGDGRPFTGRNRDSLEVRTALVCCHYPIMD